MLFCTPIYKNLLKIKISKKNLILFKDEMLFYSINFCILVIMRTQKSEFEFDHWLRLKTRYKWVRKLKTQRVCFGVLTLSWWLIFSDFKLKTCFFSSHTVKLSNLNEISNRNEFNRIRFDFVTANRTRTF